MAADFKVKIFNSSLALSLVCFIKKRIYMTPYINLNWAGSLHAQSPLNNPLTYKKSLKNFQFQTIAKIPFNISLEQVDVWFQDEARFGQQNTTTRIWAQKGSRPRAIRQQQFTYARLFGAVCVTNGNTEAIVAPVSNMDVMSSHLALISQATQPGRHAVVPMDGASWHQEYLAAEFHNLTIIHIPPYFSELNPIEQVWS